jgi:hypothetical protein
MIPKKMTAQLKYEIILSLSAKSLFVIAYIPVKTSVSIIKEK